MFQASNLAQDLGEPADPLRFHPCEALRDRAQHRAVETFHQIGAFGRESHPDDSSVSFVAAPLDQSAFDEPVHESRHVGVPGEHVIANGGGGESTFVANTFQSSVLGEGDPERLQRVIQEAIEVVGDTKDLADSPFFG